MHRTPRWVKVFAAIGIIVVVLALAVLLFGGGEHGPGRHAVPGDDRGPTPADVNATQGGVGAPADAGDADRRVVITAYDNMTFEPRAVLASPGETITFVVTNAGEADHEFVLGDAQMQEDRATMREHMGEHTPHDATNAVHVKPGETREITWRVGTGPLEYACHEPGHYAAGMRGQISVG